MSAHDIPASWTFEMLSNVAEVVQGQSPPGSTYNSDGKGMPFFQGKAEFGPIHPIAAKWCTEPGKVAEPGDVLISIRAPVGPTNLADVRCCIGRGLAAISPRGQLPPRFLLYYLRHSDVLLARQATGSTFQAISGAQLRRHPFVVPPLLEQHRIVSAIESYFTRLDDVVATLDRVQRNLKRYRASVLKAAVEGRLVPTEDELARTEGRTYEPASVLLERILAERRRRWEEAELAKMKAEGKVLKYDKWRAKYIEPVPPDTRALPELPAGWCWASVDQLAQHVSNALTDGPFGSNLKSSHYTSSGPRVIRLQNIGDGTFIDAEAHISTEHFAALSKHTVVAGDLVMASLGTDIPRACVVPAWLGPAVVKADCLRFAVHSSLMLPWFAAHALNSPPSRKRAESLVHGVGRPRIGLTLLRSFPLPVPPLLEQHRVVEEVERLLSLSAEVGTAARSNVARCSTARQSILKWAFEGRLVDQDPNDEPASALLERIRAERASSITDKSRRPVRRKARSTIA